MDRRQTEGEVQRNFYVVEITNFIGRKTSQSSVEDAGKGITEIYHVDLSRILEYVSADELERFENEQFQIEAEAEAIAMHIEAEEVARRRLEKNARAAATGQGSRMFKDLGLDGEVRTRGRPRGRGRGRGRGSWRGSGALTMMNKYDMREELVDVEREEALRREEDMQLIIAETDSEDDDVAADSQARTSPNIARSAFVANSALPVSPPLPYRRPSMVAITQRDTSEALEDDEAPDIELVNRDARSMSSAAMQLRVEEDDRGRSIAETDEGSSHSHQHRGKRRRTESTASNQRQLPTKTTLPERRLVYQDSYAPNIPESSADSDASSDAIPAQEPIAAYRSLQPRGPDFELDNINVQSPVVGHNGEHQSEDGGADQDEDVEKYVVEAIIEHYREAGKTHYLVKWQGYEDRHDWLPEDDLEGAAELVAEYNERVRRRKLMANKK